VPSSSSRKKSTPQQRRFSSPSGAAEDTFEERFGRPPQCIFPSISTAPTQIEGITETYAPVPDYSHKWSTQSKILARSFTGIYSCSLILAVCLKTVWWYATYNHDQCKANLVDHAHRIIKGKMSKQLSKVDDRKDGHVYIFKDTRYTKGTRFKIGFSTVSADARHNKPYYIRYFESKRIPNARRAEMLCHDELKQWRDHSDVEALRRSGHPDYVGTESYLLPLEIVEQTVRRWCGFVSIEPSPYDKTGNLIPTWSHILMHVDDSPCIYEKPENHHTRHERWTEFLKLVKDDSNDFTSWIYYEVKILKHRYKRWLSLMEERFLRWSPLTRIGAILGAVMVIYRLPLVHIGQAFTFLFLWSVGRVVFT
jgi:hypothetical protein